MRNRGVRIRWTDVATNEIGFRIEKRPVGTQDWQIVAYQPRNESGGLASNFNPTDNGIVQPGCANQGNFDFNEQEWFDAFTQRGVQFEYRVAALDCDENDLGISDPTPPVTVPDTIVGTKKAATMQLGLAPNPAHAQITVQLEKANIGAYVITDALGRQVATGIVTSQRVVVPVDKLAPGVYQISVRQGTEFGQRTFVKE